MPSCAAPPSDASPSSLSPSLRRRSRGTRGFSSSRPWRPDPPQADPRGRLATRPPTPRDGCCRRSWKNAQRRDEILGFLRTDPPVRPRPSSKAARCSQRRDDGTLSYVNSLMICLARASSISLCLGTGCFFPVLGLLYKSCLPPCLTRTHPSDEILLMRSILFIPRRRVPLPYALLAHLPLSSASKHP